MLYDPNWKPKEDRKVKRKDLTEQEIASLLRVREGLLNGEIGPKHFDMGTVVEGRRGCGTVGCIGGWIGIFSLMDEHGWTAKKVAKKSGDAFFVTEERPWAFMNNSKWNYLFYPSSRVMENAKPADGARAIENFLYGKPHERQFPWAFMNLTLYDKGAAFFVMR